MNYEEMLRIASLFLNCPVCGSKFSVENIHFKGFIDEKFVIQTECDSGHAPLNALFISTISGNINESQASFIPLSSNDFLDLKLRLVKFDGNFEKVFQKEQNGKIDIKSKNP